MPEDTKYIVNQSQLTAIGTAIREKLNEQTTYTVDEMPGKIEDISGGGGVSIPFDICNITIVNNTSSPIMFMVVPQLRNSALIVKDTTIEPIIVEANSEYQMVLPFVWVSDPDTPEIMIFFQNRMNFSNAVNCSYVAGESDQPGAITRTTNGNASITLSVPTEV